MIDRSALVFRLARCSASNVLVTDSSISGWVILDIGAPGTGKEEADADAEDAPDEDRGGDDQRGAHRPRPAARGAGGGIR